MDDRRVKKGEILNKVNYQITRIEQIINNLLEDIKIDEMSTYERLTMANKFIAQHQRALELQQTCILDEPQTKESLIIGTLMRQMRGEHMPIVRITEEEEDGTND